MKLNFNHISILLKTTMTIFSTLRPHIRVTVDQLYKGNVFGTVSKRRMGDHGQRHFEIKTCYWNFFKTLDLFHLYCSLALLIYGPIVLYANIFIGPATLAEIPEGYKPKHWEYYKHPISRFIEKYCFSDPQMLYEKYLSHLYKEDWRLKLSYLDDKVKYKMKVKQDYKAYYYRPISANTYRLEEFDERHREERFAYNPKFECLSSDFKDENDLPPPVEN